MKGGDKNQSLQLHYSMQNLKGKSWCFTTLRKSLVKQQTGYLLAGVLQTKSYASQRGTRPVFKRKQNYYDVLALTPKATQAQIKTAYYEMSKAYHPDVNKSREASAKFAEISEAYETLGNIQKRRLYDHGFFNPSGTRTGATPFEGAQGFGEPRRHPAPPTGRTNMYNFDEFYRQHYGDSIDGKQKARQATHDREAETLRRKGEHTFAIFILGVIGGIILTVWPFAKSRRRGKHDS